MGNFLRLSSGVPRSFAEAGSLPTIYDQTLLLVASSPGAGEILGPITSGTAITLPSSGNYTGAELIVELNGVDMDSSQWSTVGSGTKTQISFTFDLVVGDKIRFKKYRNE